MKSISFGKYTILIVSRLNDLLSNANIENSEKVVADIMRHDVEFSSLFFGIILIPYLVIVNNFTLFVFMPFPAFTLVTMF